jgi:hypothetical protein
MKRGVDTMINNTGHFVIKRQREETLFVNKRPVDLLFRMKTQVDKLVSNKTEVGKLSTTDRLVNVSAFMIRFSEARRITISR